MNRAVKLCYCMLGMVYEINTFITKVQVAISASRLIYPAKS